MLRDILTGGLTKYNLSIKCKYFHIVSQYRKLSVYIQLLDIVRLNFFVSDAPVIVLTVSARTNKHGFYYSVVLVLFNNLFY